MYNNLLCNSHMCVVLQYGQTALHNAASRGHIEIATLLIDSGCDLNAPDKASITLFITYDSHIFTV